MINFCRYAKAIKLKLHTVYNAYQLPSLLARRCQYGPPEHRKRQAEEFEEFLMLIYTETIKQHSSQEQEVVMAIRNEPLQSQYAFNVAASIYEPFQEVFGLTWRHIHTLVFLWTIITLLSQIWRTFQQSRQCQLPQPTTQSERQKQRVKLAIPMLYNIKLHFVWRPKKGGVIGKLGVSLTDIKLLVIAERSSDSEWSLKGQAKFYGSLSMVKCATDIQWKMKRQLFQDLPQSWWLKKRAPFQMLILKEVCVSSDDTAVV